VRYKCVSKLCVLSGTRSGDLPANSIEDQHNTTVHHIPLIPREVIHQTWDKVVIFDSKGGKHGLLPEASSTKVCRERVDDAKCQNAFDRPGNDGERELMRVVLVPRLDVECQERYIVLARSIPDDLHQLTSEKCKNSLPALPQIHCRREQQHLECGIDRINAVVEQLSQGPALARSARLASIHRIECLV
jgi:hypothetical protein